MQDLVGLAANLEVAAGALDADPAAARTILDELRRDARRTLTELREVATRVFPPLLEAGGLVAELRTGASRAGVRSRIDADADVVRTSPPEIVGAIYFCALDVFERASDGATVDVSVRGEADALGFQIDAEGDLGSERRAAHDRVEALDGQVTVTVRSGRTTVVGSLPIP
jgi:signal transduction histidine kinase